MITFIDLEASGLSSDSWPVEVGLAWPESGRPCSAGRLIRPESHWPTSAWSAESAAVHGIPLAELRAAEPAPEVARWVLDRVAGRRLVSDAPPWDRAWLATLLATLGEGVAVPRLHDFDAVVARRYDFAGVRRVYAHLDAHPAPHRAAADAERLLRAWLAGRGVER